LGFISGEKPGELQGKAFAHLKQTLLLGINSMISAQSQGIAFAITINIAWQIITPWMK
jgi:S1-C subfamily serine protease